VNNSSAFITFIVIKIVTMHELSKGEKKVARAAIDKGLDAEFTESMENVEAIIKDWREGKFISNKEAYHKLFKAVNDKNDAISSRYDGLTGGRYLTTVMSIFVDGYINEKDIEGFKEETKEIITSWAKR
jgi:hypothetical protein